MKCIALFTSFVVVALAESEPFLGSFGYAGIGRPAYGYANAYGLGTLARRTYIPSAPVVTRTRVTPVAPALSAVTPVVAPAAPAVTPVVAPAAPVVAPDVAPYVSTATLNAVPAAPSTLQFHKQDELGNYEYGYDNVNSAKKEVGNARVGVTGSYTVKDLQGPRTVHYVADALGFRATPAHGRKKRSLFYSRGPLSSYPGVYSNFAASPYRYSVATPAVAAVPAVAANAVPVSTSVLKAIPSAPSTSQFHKQDELGNYEYGYQNVNSAKHEGGNARTGVTGGYSYRDAFGIERTFNYVADGLGFRVSPTLLRHKRQVAVVPSNPVATHPATMMIIRYNPGYSTGYRVYH